MNVVRRATTPWLTAVPDPRAAVRLFCFPYAGGAASTFRTWGGALPRWLEVCLVELPGRGTRFHERPYQRLSDLVDDAYDALLPAFDWPFGVFGHSMGALIAFELARRLRARGGPSPRHIFVSGHRAPQLPDTRRARGGLPDRGLEEELRTLNGTAPEILENPELLELVLPILRADFGVCEGYRYEHDAPLAAPISAFGGRSDPEVDEAAIEAWRVQTRSTFKLRMLPGDHFFIHAPDPVLRVVAEELSPHV